VNVNAAMYQASPKKTKKKPKKIPQAAFFTAKLGQSATL
jgi:hypothetical protein